MLRYLRHRHALGQAETADIDIVVALPPAVAAVDLQELPLRGLGRRSSLARSGTTAAWPVFVLVAVLLQLDELRKA
jgi:hypothetical protein